jgi:DNA-binding NtrC family response regulator
MKKSILIVEEHEHLRKLLSMFLSKKFQVLPASNGLEAMGWVRRGLVPNVIVSGSWSQGNATQAFFNSLPHSGILAHTPVIRLFADQLSTSVDLVDLQERLYAIAGNMHQPRSVEPVLVPEAVGIVLN